MTVDVRIVIRTLIRTSGTGRNNDICVVSVAVSGRACLHVGEMNSSMILLDVPAARGKL